MIVAVSVAAGTSLLRLAPRQQSRTSMTDVGQAGAEAQFTGLAPAGPETMTQIGTHTDVLASRFIIEKDGGDHHARM